MRRTSFRLVLVSFALDAAVYGLLAILHRPIAELILGDEFAAAAWLAPRYGAVGAAWANTACFIAFVVVLMPFVISILR